MKSFSLIELLVVVAIIAVLAAAAIPAYTQYGARTQIAAVLPVMQNVIANLESSYQAKGAFPTPIVIGGTTFMPSAMTGGQGAGWAGVSFPGMNVGYTFVFISSDGKGVGLGFSFSQLRGVPGFVAVANGASTNGTLYFASREINGAMVNVCGGNNNMFSADIPAGYRPSKCSCANVGLVQTSGFINTGTGC